METFRQDKFEQAVGHAVHFIQDRDLSIDWKLPKKTLLLSDKDKQQPTLAKLNSGFTFKENDYE